MHKYPGDVILQSYHGMKSYLYPSQPFLEQAEVVGSLSEMHISLTDNPSPSVTNLSSAESRPTTNIHIHLSTCPPQCTS